MVQDIEIAQQLMELERQCNEMHRYAIKLSHNARIISDRFRAEFGVDSVVGEGDNNDNQE